MRTKAAIIREPKQDGWEIVDVDIDDPKGCLAIFRSNRDAGLIVAAAFVLG